jgi:hypothetical protein
MLGCPGCNGETMEYVEPELWSAQRALGSQQAVMAVEPLT